MRPRVCVKERLEGAIRILVLKIAIREVLLLEGANAFVDDQSQRPAEGPDAQIARLQPDQLLQLRHGAAPMPPALLKIWQDRGCVFVQGYGMTETSPTVLLLEVDDVARKTGSVGRPVLHGDPKIVREDGSLAQPGERGELWVRGPNVTPGYWQSPDANTSSFTDGWLHTGDTVRKDEEVFYYIVDRTKDMYISGGENVYPAEVEEVLYQIAAIAEAAVISVPNERWGENGLAIVVLKQGASVTEVEILAHCRERLSHFKCPRHVVFIDALPRNATGKVHKPTLRANFTTLPRSRGIRQTTDPFE